METYPRWIGYDTFKLIVAIVLLILLLALILQPPPAAAPAAANPAPAPTGTQALAIVAAPPTAAPALPPTPAPIPGATSTPLVPPTAAPTSAPTAAPTSMPTNTPASATAAPTAAPTASPAAACKPPAPSRLVAGKNAGTLGDLNLRSEPKIDNNILTVNPTGTTLKVLQGPVCVPFQGSAYLWWQVETPGGKTGWSAENYLNGLGYYMKPLP